MVGQWRRSYFAPERVARLTHKAPRPDAVRTWAEAQDVDALLAARHHPDHSPAARALITEVLLARGVDPAAIEGWTPQAASLSARPFGMVRSGEQVLADRRARQRSRAPFRAVLIAGVIAFFALYLPSMALYAAPQLESVRVALATPFAIAVVVIFAWVVLVNLALALRLADRRPVRITLFRPFGSAKMTAPLRRFARRHLGSFGHVYTLSDRSYAPGPGFSLVTQVLGFLSNAFAIYFVAVTRPSLRIATVTHEGGYRALKARIRKRSNRSAMAFLTGGQAQNVRTSDAWWQRVAEMLAHSSQAIVMDLTRVGSGSAWELERLARRGLLARTVFIAHEAAAESARLIVQGVAVDGSGAVPLVYLYNDRGSVTGVRRGRAPEPVENAAEEIAQALAARAAAVSAEWADAEATAKEAKKAARKAGKKAGKTTVPPAPSSLPQTPSDTATADHETSERPINTPAQCTKRGKRLRKGAPKTPASLEAKEFVPPLGVSLRGQPREET